MKNSENKEKEFIVKIWKGNSKGTGFLPFDYKIGRYVNIFIYPNISFFAIVRSYKGHNGAYIPASINKKIKTPNVTFKVSEFSGIPLNFGSDGRFYIPLKHVKDKKLEKVTLAHFKPA